MATFVYDTAYEEALDGGLDWTAGDFLVILAGAGPLDPAASVRDDIDDVLATASLTGMAVLAGGVADADDVSVPGVTAAETVERVFICRDTGSASTDTLIWATSVHTDSTPILRVSDGNPIVVSWSNGAGRIFQI